MNDPLTTALARGPRVGRPPTFPDADVAYAAHDTVVGRLLLARLGSTGPLVACVYAATADSEEALAERLARTCSPRVLRLPHVLDDARREIDDYLAGQRHTIEIAVDLSLATAFQREVLTTLAARVGYGRRATYGELAGWVGRPAAARAVGTALGANPLCIALPCHRVVGASGALAGYAGGLPAKEHLLALESPGARRALD
ncbi:MAG TPA: methylated-DNA--[protein]-cysteine S-methyltransferase [Dermatophilaceae bacterium]|nr:methylated-DNA--[protein]-cysteine S-methyltransferase [Dermatophilaceae bacterium]